MNTKEIENILLSCKLTAAYFKGVFSLNKIPTRFSTPAALVINSHPQAFPGEHWLALFIQEKQTPFSNSTIEFFDSYGVDFQFYQMPPHIVRDIHIQNKNVIQDLNKSTCGEHVIYFIYHRCLGLSLDEIVKNHYSENLTLNDSLASNFVHTYLPLEEKCSFQQNTNSVTHQSCITRKQFTHRLLKKQYLQ